MRLLVLCLGLGAGCAPVEPSGNPFVPVPVARGPVTPAAGPSLEPDRLAGDREPAPPAGPGEFDFEAEDRAPAPAPIQPVPERETAVAPIAPAMPAPAAPIWDPSMPIPDAGFGVRVVTVLLDIQPPRAILGLPDGTEQVVTPGAMVPSQGLVVLAIGRDAVQVAKVTPAGYAARVDTQTLRALYPSGSTGSTIP